MSVTELQTRIDTLTATVSTAKATLVTNVGALATATSTTLSVTPSTDLSLPVLAGLVGEIDADVDLTDLTASIDALELAVDGDE
ncbi:MAG: hypothetical protein LBQ66_00370 [Planctomycetaceae bacterium]|jgi:hypothetical protein|nr:hypothetical protein [Planctomycetaceae bacterium]